MGTAVRVALVGLVAVLLIITLVWALQRRLIYVRSGPPPATALTALAGGAQVTLHTEDGVVLSAWEAPATAVPRGVTVLVGAGNAGSRADRVPLARNLAAAGFDVLLLEYRGYGGNPGTPTEEGLAADARAAHRYLVADRGVSPQRLVLFGESLGAAVMTRLATERPVAALVLRSPFTSLADVGARVCPFLPVRALLRDRYPVLELVEAVRVPVAVVAGGADELVPVEQSRAVATAARASYVEVAGARHDDPALSSGPEVVAAVERVSPA